MTLASGAHVKIGSYEFLLDETVDAGTQVGNLYRPHYKYTANSLFASRVGIPGDSTKENIRPERLLWDITDWSGGEGWPIYSKNVPNQYLVGSGQDTGTMSNNPPNPRLKGKLMGPPLQVWDTTSGTTAEKNCRSYLGIGAGTVWYASSYRIGYVSNPSTSPWTWQVVDSTGVVGTDYTGLQHLTNGTDYRITAVAGDGDKFFYSAVNPTSGKRITLAHTKVNGAPTVLESEVSGPGYAGMARLQGKLYGWTGRTLNEFDVTTTYPLTATVRDSIGPEFANGSQPNANNNSTSYCWGGICAAETSVFYFATTDGSSVVFEYNSVRGSAPVFTAPFGFSITCIGYANGVVYVGGIWGSLPLASSADRGVGEMWAIPLDTRRALALGQIRGQVWATGSQNEEADFYPVAITPSYKNQILVSGYGTGSSLPSTFVYDPDEDAFSMLDYGSSSFAGIAAWAYPITFGSKRCILYGTTGSGAGTNPMSQISHDRKQSLDKSTSTGSNISTITTQAWDFDLPFEQKVLVGFDVTFEPLTTGQTIKIRAYIDGVAASTTQSITYTDADASKGRTFLSTVIPGSSIYGYKFNSLYLVITLQADRVSVTDYAPPVLLGVCAEAQNISYERTWDLILKLKNPQTGSRSGKAATTVYGDAARDFIRASVDSQQPVQFLDGYRYKKPGHYSTHSVTIENPEDIIIRPGEGSMRITLRAVPT